MTLNSGYFKRTILTLKNISIVYIYGKTKKIFQRRRKKASNPIN